MMDEWSTAENKKIRWVKKWVGVILETLKNALWIAVSFKQVQCCSLNVMRPYIFLVIKFYDGAWKEFWCYQAYVRV